MAAQAAAALLDELMGRNRNKLPNQDGKDLDWDSAEVCKYFLCGFCPHDLFTNTRADLGPCAKIHDEELRRQYQKSSRCEKMGYEQDFVKYLQSIMSEVDRRIKRGLSRLAMNAAATTTPAPLTPKDEKVVMLTNKINELVEQAEELGCAGKVEEAQGVMKLCDQLREERTQLEQNAAGLDGLYNNQLKEMEVCMICGAFLVKNDAPQRVDDHIQGKQHVGYARIREYVDTRTGKRRPEVVVDADGDDKRKREDERRAAISTKELESKMRREREEKERDERRRHHGDGRRRSRSRSPSDKSRRRSRSRDRSSRDKDRVRRDDRDRSSRDGDRRHSSSSKDHHRRSRSRDRKRE